MGVGGQPPLPDRTRALAWVLSPGPTTTYCALGPPNSPVRASASPLCGCCEGQVREKASSEGPGTCRCPINASQPSGSMALAFLLCPKFVETPGPVLTLRTTD